MKKITKLFLLLFTIPLQAQWVQQNSGVFQDLNDVYCITENTVVVVGAAGTLLKTIDGGANWVQKTTGTTSNLRKVQFANSNIGYAVGSTGTLLKTVNGGENWISIPTGTTANLYGLSCINENSIYLSGDSGLIKRSDDGGATFINQNYTGSHPMKNIQFLNDQIGYASSFDPYEATNNAFIKTTDAGVTWTLVSNDPISSFYFLNENIGFIKKAYQPIYKTTDGGLNSTYMGESNSETGDLFASNENEVWNVENVYTLCSCSSFCIYKRNLTNTGEYQEIENCHTYYTGALSLEAIYFANETNGYAVGWSGTILKNTTGTMVALGINAVPKNEAIALYPNPATNQITLHFNETPSSAFTVELTDILGKTIYSQLYPAENNVLIPISFLSKGVYLMKSVLDKGPILKKFIKN